MRDPVVPRARRLTRAGLLDAVDRLCTLDPDLAVVIRRFGPPPLWARRPGFATLVRIVLEQQVSLASARATYDRLRHGAGRVTAPKLAALSETRLRTFGITRQKASYIRGIARAICQGTLDLAAVGRLTDEDARQRLRAIRGIGAWTADIYLLMALLRPDIWPDGDLALAEAARRAKRWRSRPSAERLRRLAEGWTPWRAVAARILWHAYLSEAAPAEPAAD